MNPVERFATAFNRRDVDGLLDCFTADATYHDLFYGPHAGQAALRGMFERMFREGQDYHWSMDVIVEDERRAPRSGRSRTRRRRRCPVARGAACASPA